MAPYDRNPVGSAHTLIRRKASDCGWEQGRALVVKVQTMIATIRDGASQKERTTLIAELSALLCHHHVPEKLRQSGLDAVGKLARRDACEPACCRGLQAMQERVQKRK